MKIRKKYSFRNMLMCSLDLRHTFHCIKTFSSASRNQSLHNGCVCVSVIPAPVGLSYCRIVHYGWQQGREGPQQESGEELSDDRALQWKNKTNCRFTASKAALKQVRASACVRLTLR